MTTDDNGETGSLRIVDTVNRTIRKIDVVTDYEEVQWRPPDGRQLMVTARASGGLRFVLVSMVDDRVEVLPTPDALVGDGLRPGGWSLDGRRFLYAVSDEQVHVLDMEGGGDRVIPPSNAQDTAGYPRFSNDGRSIVFMEWSTGDPSWLSVAPSDGSKPAIRVSDIYPDPIGTNYHWSRTTARYSRAQRGSPRSPRSCRRSAVDPALVDRERRVLAAPRALIARRVGALGSVRGRFGPPLLHAHLVPVDERQPRLEPSCSQGCAPWSAIAIRPFWATADCAHQGPDNSPIAA